MDTLHCAYLSSANGHSGCIHLVTIVNAVYVASTCVKLDSFFRFLGRCLRVELGFVDNLTSEELPRCFHRHV